MKFLKRFVVSRKKYFIILLFLILIGLVLKLFFSLRIQNIVCTTQFKTICDKALINDLVVVKGKTLFSSKASADKELKDRLSISNYSLKLIFPDTLLINVYVNKPRFVIEPKNGNRFYLVDKNGLIIEEKTSTSLAILQTEKNSYEIGKKVDEEEMFALKILEGVYNMYQIKYAKFESGVIKIQTEDRIELIFPTNGEKEVLLGSTRLILSRLNNISLESNIERVTSIDLRYKNPIIK